MFAERGFDVTLDSLHAHEGDLQLVGPAIRFRCPVKLAPIELHIHWSAQLERDPASIWFRTLAEGALRVVFRPSRQRPSRRCRPRS